MTYFGKICPKHPELEGLRYSLANRKCFECERVRINLWKKNQRYKAKQKEYRTENKGLMVAAVAKYKADKDRRTPLWADREKIKAVYRSASELGMAVDHIIPLRGKTVSGLHVHNNLQLLPGIVNSSKGNRF